MILDGAKLAASKRTELAAKVTGLSFQPGLGIIVATDNPATAAYIARKQAGAEEVGFLTKVTQLSPTATAEEIAAACQEFNADPQITGYIVQLPLPPGIDKLGILAAVDPSKDADGLSPLNLGYLAAGAPRIVPATPRGVLTLLESNDIVLRGRTVAILGKGFLVGAPLSVLLAQRGATVTTCDSKTRNTAFHTLASDIIITAVGVAGLLTADMVTEGAVVVDVGMVKTENGLRGDVDFEPVAAKASAITPVPGGVGPMTVVSLLENVYDLAVIAEQAGA